MVLVVLLLSLLSGEKILMFWESLSRRSMPHSGAGGALGLWSSDWDAIIVSPVLGVGMLISRVRGIDLVVLLLLMLSGDGVLVFREL